MKKDVIYIDIEDDITSIIEKVKNADAKIVALVPPKRVGVLQSIVNLKLLQRAADSSDHRIVLITNNHALTSLAAGISIPVAKNLQSKPEIAPIDALDIDDEDIINGEELPVGEHAAIAGEKEDKKLNEDAADVADTIDEDVIEPPASIAAASAAKPKPKSGAKIPNFETFRKKILIFGALGVVLIIFLWWATVIAPHGTVTISAKTSSVPVNQPVTLDPAVAASNVASGVFKPQTQTLKKSQSLQFTATGQKDIGNKATGQVKLTNQTSGSITVPAGTQFVANNLQFLSDTAVTLPASSTCGIPVHICYGSGTINVTAASNGPNYNIPGPVTFSTSAPVTAQSDAGTSGGTSQIVTVVSQDDVTKAQQQLASQSADDIKKQLVGQFTGDVIIINESFAAKPGDPTPTPAVGAQASGPATLTQETTYTMLAVTRTDVKAYLASQLHSSVKDNQRIYVLGDNSLKFSQFSSNNQAYTVQLTTSGNIGPNIDVAKLKTQIQGKRYGDVQQIVSQYDGIDNVDVKLTPFWVSTVPGPDKTDVEFKVTNGSQ